MEVGVEGLIAVVAGEAGSEYVLRGRCVVRLRCGWCGTFLRDLLEGCWRRRRIAVVGFAVSSFPAGTGLPVTTFEDDTGDALEFGTYAQHAFYATLLFRDGEK